MLLGELMTLLQNFLEQTKLYHLLHSRSSLLSDNKTSIYISHTRSETLLEFFYNCCILLRSVYWCHPDSPNFFLTQTRSYLFGFSLSFLTKMFRCSYIITTTFYICQTPHKPPHFIYSLLFTFPLFRLGFYPSSVLWLVLVYSCYSCCF